MKNKKCGGCECGEGVEALLYVDKDDIFFQGCLHCFVDLMENLAPEVFKNVNSPQGAEKRLYKAIDKAAMYAQHIKTFEKGGSEALRKAREEEEQGLI